MNMGDSATMYFVMPKEYSKNQLPTPTSKNVQILEESEKTLAVIAYGGFSSDKDIEKYRQKLAAALEQNQIQTKGNYMYMGYNAPWDVVNRRNEVAIEVVLE
jgi:effector-binding domain-containing protein